MRAVVRQDDVQFLENETSPGQDSRLADQEKDSEMRVFQYIVIPRSSRLVLAVFRGVLAQRGP